MSLSSGYDPSCLPSCLVDPVEGLGKLSATRVGLYVYDVSPQAVSAKDMEYGAAVRIVAIHVV